MIPWTVVHHAPLSLGSPRQEYWSGLPFPFLGYLPELEIKSMSPTLADGFVTTESPEKPVIYIVERSKDIRSHWFSSRSMSVRASPWMQHRFIPKAVASSSIIIILVERRHVNYNHWLQNSNPWMHDELAISKSFGKVFIYRFFFFYFTFRYSNLLGQRVGSSNL